MTIQTLPPSVVAAGEVVALSDSWAVTTDIDVKMIFPMTKEGERIAVKHLTHVITCHHLGTGKQVVFSRKKTHWHDSRKGPVVRKRGLFVAPKLENDWRSTTISKRDVIAEVARMGGGDRAAAIVSDLVS
jgi:hypothetical protein